MIDRQGCQEKNILCHKTGLPNYVREKGCQGTNILHHHKTGLPNYVKEKGCQGISILHHKTWLPTYVRETGLPSN